MNAVAEAGLGLRERKKLRTRQVIRDAAQRLIHERGYENTTIELIAAAAEVSPSTVFRYFPTKEQIVLRDEDYAISSVALLRARPIDEPPLVALREAVIEGARISYEEFNAEYRWRMELVRKVPALRAQMYEGQDRAIAVLTAALAERIGRQADDLELRVLVGAMLGGLHQVVLEWGDHGQEGDLVEMMNGALAKLELGPSPQDTRKAAR
ncbi:Putative mycofactocin biosynthesis transcriptional regulator MftR (plasmid) [Streptomyces xanthophaeus]|uniref:TetR/AcrR family transcriptional regulator n=1 Tax=Streptomyces xanthophaeus TaxID=67385 RepID=UPI00233E9F91|nr:TetR family transcriptional regulator [Streptomyces xanthophaeus]WCD91414.1 Putative mycofactocin biosynthesis transcriptional regulator MftR [Streptomyces xanthophaeus]